MQLQAGRVKHPNSTAIVSHYYNDEDLLENVLQNWHLLFSGLVLPVICGVSLLENALAIWVLLKMRTGYGIGATSRAYYIVLAAADIGNLLFYHLSRNFTEFGLRYVSGGRVYFSWPTKCPTDFVCLSSKFLTFCAIVCRYNCTVSRLVRAGVIFMTIVIVI